jgi:hypothetical protein
MSQYIDAVQRGAIGQGQSKLLGRDADIKTTLVLLYRSGAGEAYEVHPRSSCFPINGRRHCLGRFFYNSLQ